MLDEPDRSAAAPGLGGVEGVVVEITEQTAIEDAAAREADGQRERAFDELGGAGSPARFQRVADVGAHVVVLELAAPTC